MNKCPHCEDIKRTTHKIAEQSKVGHATACNYFNFFFKKQNDRD